jgi:hypothetical protein
MSIQKTCGGEADAGRAKNPVPKMIMLGVLTAGD